MKKDIMYKAVGEVNPTFLSEFEQMEGQTMKKSGKIQGYKGALVAASVVLLLGASGGVLREFVGGGEYQLSPDGLSATATFQPITSQVFREEGERLFYIFDGNELEITDYCSESEYFLAPVLDETGSGYVLVIGGDVGERGYSLRHFEQGRFVAAQSDSALYGSAVDFGDSSKEAVSVSYPQATWFRHAVQFVGANLSDTWDTLADSLELDLGTGTKVSDLGYHVEGYDLGELSTSEQSTLIYLELAKEIQWLEQFGCGYSALEDCQMVTVESQWTEEKEAEVQAVLDEIGISYQLLFVED